MTRMIPVPETEDSGGDLLLDHQFRLHHVLVLGHFNPPFSFLQETLHQQARNSWNRRCWNMSQQEGKVTYCTEALCLEYMPSVPLFIHPLSSSFTIPFGIGMTIVATPGSHVRSLLLFHSSTRYGMAALLRFLSVLLRPNLMRHLGMRFQSCIVRRQRDGWLKSHSRGVHLSKASPHILSFKRSSQKKKSL